MGDVGDYWREHREYKRSKELSTGGTRRPATLVKFTKQHEAIGFRKCSDWHWQAKIGSDLLDFWPSKEKWRFRDVTKHGSFKTIERFIATERGKIT